MPTQGSQSLAKDDTHFYSVAATPTLAELAVDLSQYGEDWAVGGGGDNIWIDDARLSTSGLSGRCVEIRFDVNGLIPASTLFCRYGEPFTEANSNGIFWDGSTSIEFYVAGSLVGSIPAADLHGSTSQTYQLVWTTRANPDVSALATDGLISDAQIWNIDTGTFDQVSFVHGPFPTTGADEHFFGADDATGANSHGDNIWACRYSVGRWHSSSEGREDWIGLSTAPTLTLDDRIGQQVPPSSEGLGNSGMPVGPVEILCAKAAIQNKLRMCGPLVNHVFGTRAWLETTWAAVNAADRLSNWPSSGPQALTLYTFHVPVPPVVNRIRGRVFLQNDMDTTGSDTGDDTTHLMLVSSAKLPRTNEDVDHLYYEATVDITDDHGSTATGGQWYEFAEMDVATDANGWTWLILCVWFTGTARDQQCRIKAITVDPGLEPESGSGLPHGVGD